MKTRRQIGKGFRAYLGYSRKADTPWCLNASNFFEIKDELLTYMKNYILSKMNHITRTNEYAKWIEAVETLDPEAIQYKLNLLQFANPVLKKIKKSAKFRSFFGSCLWKNRFENEKIRINDTLYSGFFFNLLMDTDAYKQAVINSNKLKDTDAYKQAVINSNKLKATKQLQDLQQDAKTLDLLSKTEKNGPYASKTRQSSVAQSGATFKLRT